MLHLAFQVVYQEESKSLGQYAHGFTVAYMLSMDMDQSIMMKWRMKNTRQVKLSYTTK